MNRNTLKTIQKSLEKIEENLTKEAERSRNPHCIICFHAYPDGTVPNVTDRPFEQWELFKDNNGLIELSPMLEYALRKGWTKAKSSAAVSYDKEYFVMSEMPEVPPEDRIPQEEFVNWYCNERGGRVDENGRYWTE